MNTLTLETPDRYSWSRVKMLARYYGPTLKLPLIIYPLVSLVLGVINVFLQQTLLGSVLGGLLGLILGCMLYFFPLFLYRAWTPVANTLLPATVGERLTVFAIVCLVINPLLVYGPYYLMEWVMGMVITPNEYAVFLMGMAATAFNESYGLNFFQYFPPLVTCMFVVITSPRKRVGLAIGMVIATIIGLSVIGGICGVFMALDSGFRQIVTQADAYNVGVGMAGYLKHMLIGIGSLSLIYTAVMTTVAYFKMKRMQY